MSQDKKDVKKHGKTEEEQSKNEVKKTDNKGDELKKEADNLIDAIDEILEDNAEEFVKGYVQKGGE